MPLYVLIFFIHVYILYIYIFYNINSFISSIICIDSQKYWILIFVSFIENLFNHFISVDYQHYYISLLFFETEIICSKCFLYYC